MNTGQKDRLISTPFRPQHQQEILFLRKSDGTQIRSESRRAAYIRKLREETEKYLRGKIQELIAEESVIKSADAAGR